MPAPASFLTVPQLAARWQVAAESVRRLVRCRKLQAVRVMGRSIRIPIAAVMEWEKERTR